MHSSVGLLVILLKWFSSYWLRNAYLFSFTSVSVMQLHFVSTQCYFTIRAGIASLTDQYFPRRQNRECDDTCSYLETQYEKSQPV